MSNQANEILLEPTVESPGTASHGWPTSNASRTFFKIRNVSVHYGDELALDVLEEDAG